MPSLTIRHSDGSTETIPTTVGYERQTELNRMRRVRIQVDRRDAEAVTLNKKEDVIELGGEDTVRLVDVETGGPTWTLVCYSFEWDANRTEFMSGGELREGPDDSLIAGLIDDVDTWTAGDIGTFTGNLSFVFSHAHRHDALRRIERNVPGEIRFRDEGTIDYVDSLGTDKTASVELSAAAGTIEDSIQITERGRELDGTHVRVLGAHEGEAQLFANLVPSDDPNTYENRVDYQTDRWEAGDPRDWDRWENKEVTSQGVIESEAESLGGELSNDLVEVETTIVGPDVSVGDWVTVVKEDAGIHRDMRIHRLTEQSEGATVKSKALLSTRTTLRDDDSRQQRDIQQFNAGFQGSAVIESSSGGVQPVGDVDYILPFFYPEVEFEHEVELYVRSIPYRSFVSAAGHSHSFEVPAHSHTFSFDTNADADVIAGGIADASGNILSEAINETSWTTLFSVDGTDALYFSADVLPYDPDYPDNESNIRLRAIDEFGNTFPDDSGTFVRIDDRPMTGWTAVIPLANDDGASVGTESLREGTIEIQAQATSASFDLFTSYTGVSAGVPDYSVSDSETTEDGGSVADTTDAEAGFAPGVNEFTDETASNVDVLVNGSTAVSDIGSGTFTEVVDLSGELTQGAFNTIELNSDTLGAAVAALSVRSYEQIGAN